MGQTPKTIWFTCLSGAGKSTIANALEKALATQGKCTMILDGDSFVEVYVSTPLDTCMERDVKGLYPESKKGRYPHFTGISIPYEIPEHPELTIDTSMCTVEHIQ